MQAIITKENSLVKAFYTDNLNIASLWASSFLRDNFLGNMPKIVNNFLQKIIKALSYSKFTYFFGDFIGDI